VALSLVPNANDVVILGCSVPSAGTTVATVYSVDAYSTSSSAYTISLPTAVAVGSSCAGAIAALGTVTVGTGTILFAPLGGNAGLVPTNQAIPGTGYSLQEFNFTAITTTSSAVVTVSGGMGFVGCSAPGSTGATVYSVDATNVVSVTAITALNAMVGKPCSWAVARANSASNTGFGTTSLVGETVLNINSNGYSLNQYSFQ
jgi:hypothetical protein